MTGGPGDRFDVAARDRAAMERCGYERARDADVSQGREISDAPHTARRINRAMCRARDDRIEARKIRPLAAAHAGERHDDHAVRPERGIFEQAGRANEVIATEIERQRRRRTCCLSRALVVIDRAERLRSEHVTFDDGGWRAIVAERGLRACSPSSIQSSVPGQDAASRCCIR